MTVWDVCRTDLKIYEERELQVLGGGGSSSYKGLTRGWNELSLGHSTVSYRLVLMALEIMFNLDFFLCFLPCIVH